MGGHAAGEVASQLVVESFGSLEDVQPLELLSFEPLLSSINTRIRHVGSANGTSGMGTTVVGVALISNGSGLSAVIFNIGDSRCYRLVDGVLHQVTIDHSHVQELIDAGDITVEEAASHPMRNVVTRALGVDSTVRADYTVLDDVSCRLLLCSDGLSGELDDQVIRTVLDTVADPNAAALRLVEEVLAGPAPDNVTAVVVDIAFVAAGEADDTLPAPLPVADIDITAPRAATTGAVRSSIHRESADSNKGTT
jgi:protein phosphatase